MKKIVAMGFAMLIATFISGCSPDYVPIAHVEVNGLTTDQIAVVRTGNGPNDGVSGQQLVAVSTNHPEFREIGDTVQGETLTAGILRATINAAGVVMAADALDPANIDNSSRSESFSVAEATATMITEYNNCQLVEQGGRQFLKPGCPTN